MNKRHNSLPCKTKIFVSNHHHISYKTQHNRIAHNLRFHHFCLHNSCIFHCFLSEPSWILVRFYLVDTRTPHLGHPLPLPVLPIQILWRTILSLEMPVRTFEIQHQRLCPEYCTVIRVSLQGKVRVHKHHRSANLLRNFLSGLRKHE